MAQKNPAYWRLYYSYYIPHWLNASDLTPTADQLDQARRIMTVTDDEYIRQRLDEWIGKR
jgi:hypothetical protein